MTFERLKSLLRILILVCVPVFFLFTVLVWRLQTHAVKYNVDLQPGDLWMDKHLVQHIIDTEEDPHAVLRTNLIYQLTNNSYS